MAANIVVIADPTEPALEELKKLPSSANVLLTSLDVNELRSKVREADILFNCTGQRPLLQDLWPDMNNLKWIHSRFAGLDHFLFDDLVQSDIVVTNAKGAFSSALAEFVIGGCLYFAKDFNRLRRSQAEGRFDRFVMQELRGATMGVVGYGDIGQACAKMGKAFGMNIVALRRRPELSAGDGVANEVLGFDRLNKLMAKSDYVVSALPLTRETRHFVGSDNFACMKATGVFLNVGRGPTVDQEALVAALQQKTIRGAALDVFETEPIPEGDPIYSLDNVLMSAHCADWTPRWLEDATAQFVDNVKRYISGEALLNIVDKSRGY